MGNSRLLGPDDSVLVVQITSPPGPTPHLRRLPARRRVSCPPHGGSLATAEPQHDDLCPRPAKRVATGVLAKPCSSRAELDSAGETLDQRLYQLQGWRRNRGPELLRLVTTRKRLLRWIAPVNWDPAKVALEQRPWGVAYETHPTPGSSRVGIPALRSIQSSPAFPAPEVPSP